MNSHHAQSDSDDGLGYEVVDDPGYEVVEPPAARPQPAAPAAARAIPQAKLLPTRPAPVARPVAAPANEAPRTARVIHDAETTEIPRAKARTKVIRAVDDDEDDRPRRKKKRRPVAVLKDDDESSNLLMEWAGPGFLILLGLVLTTVGTYGLARGPEMMVPPVAAVAFRIVGELIAIPITIVALMVIGSVMGIEYGTFGQAVRSLAAMGFLVGGLIDIFEYVGLPLFVYQPIVFMVGLGLFMTLMKLDIGEALATMFGLNLMSWAFQMVMFMVMVSILASEAKKSGQWDDDPGYHDTQGQFLDDEDGFAPEDDGFNDPFGDE